MGVLSGPFKIVLQALERSSAPDTLGDPTAARVRSELARLFQLDEETASNIVSAMPIVILDELDTRTAGVVRERLQVLRDAGCRVVVTDEVTDTIPRVNWPQLPPIARVEGSTDSGREPRPSGAHADGLACPHCGGGLQLVASGAPRGGPRPAAGREPDPDPAPVMREARESAREPARSATSRAEEDDWLSPPVGSGVPVAHGGPAGAFGSTPPSTTARRPSGRFDDAALLAYRRADPIDDRRTADRAPAPVPTTLGTATSASEVLEVSFSDSGELEPALAEQARRGAAPAAAPAPSAEPARGRKDPFEKPTAFDEPAFDEPTFDDDEPPARGAASFDSPRSRGSDPFEEARSRGSDPFDDDEPSLLDSDDGFEAPPPPARGRSASTAQRRPPEPQRPASRSRSPDPFEDSLAGLDAPAASSSSSRSADPFASQPPGRDPFASSPSRSGQASRSGAADPFEDSRVLDDLSGLSGVSAGDLESDVGRDPLEDSGSDILDEPPPHRRQDTGGAKRGGGNVRFESDLDILDGAADLGASDELPPPPPPSRRAAPAASSSRDLLDDDDALSLLDSDDDGPPPPPPSRRKGSSRSGPDLDDVLNMFGPEDDAPLDDGSGLEPAPLDLSPPGAGRSSAKPRAKGGERGFDAELSDILEPLDPGEALEIIKTSKPGRRSVEVGAQGRGSQTSRGGPAANGRHDEPSGLEQLDLSEAGAMLAEAKHDRRSGKKSRGVPFPASDEDVGLFEESSRSGRPNKKKTDPFARARGRMAEEEERDRRPGSDRASSDRPGSDRASSERPGSDRAGSDRAGSERRAEARESASDRPRTDPRGGGKRPAGGPAPTGDGDHGLVLSRIADPDKKEQAAEIIAEVKGCNIDEARRLTDRTIIPVLKGVSREVAEFHLEKFKRVKIAGRVTTRQRG